jgi:hypothetical protein
MLRSHSKSKLKPVFQLAYVWSLLPLALKIPKKLSRYVAKQINDATLACLAAECARKHGIKAFALCLRNTEKFLSRQTSLEARMILSASYTSVSNQRSVPSWRS